MNLPRFVPLQAAENVSPAGASAQSTAAPTSTLFARICATADVRYRIESNPTAVSTDALLPMGVVEYIAMTPGLKLAFLGTATVSVQFGTN